MSKFVIKPTAKGVKFDLKATNGEVIATSEVYTAEPGCRKGIDSVVKNAAVAAVEDQTVEGFAVAKNPKFELYTDKAGEFRFRLKARNGQIIATSEGYKAKAGCLNGIESVKKNAPTAAIEMAETEAKA
ncbi:MAG: YegP family protein [Pyramidobacter sp.]|nr:YegP family protein [Pyramidobacter sp.]